MDHLTDNTAHSTVSITPVVEHWLEREIAQCVHQVGSICLYTIQIYCASHMNTNDSDK